MKKIIPYINAENELEESIVKKAISYEHNGADEIFIYNYSIDEKEQEEFLFVLKEIAKQVTIPVMAGYVVKRFEDVKKVLYTGAVRVVIPFCKLSNTEVIKESAKRFGKEKLVMEFDENPEKCEGILSDPSLLQEYLVCGIGSLLLKHLYVSDGTLDKIAHLDVPVYIRDSLLRNDLETLMNTNQVIAVSTNYFEGKDIHKIKNTLQADGLDMDVMKSSIPFAAFKKDANGLVPVIVQEYKTNEVLMMAYMNEESYQMTLETGKMTYYSRSRQKLWLKGETSGHFQYVKSLKIDCDEDTILAKVEQIGAACHTGNHSCFYRDLMNKEVQQDNSSDVLGELYDTIINRKQNPKEGSYTNYLFDKGIDKILKKCGEEATEIIIAAKNPQKEELVYEVADFMYHVSVLMAEKNLTWNDIFDELKHRH